MTRAIFFDFGGTLVEPMRDGFPVFAEVLGRRGHPLDRPSYDRAQAIVGRTAGPEYLHLGKSPGFWDTYHAGVLDRLGLVDPDGGIVSELHEAFTSPRWHPPYLESAEVLRGLKGRGLDLHLVSNNTDYLPELVGRLGWSPLFRSITYSQEVGAEKPDPRIFRLALGRAGCAPGEVLHVGDSWEADVLGARAVSIPALWIDRAGRGPPAPAPSARDLRGVLDHLDRGSRAT